MATNLDPLLFSQSLLIGAVTEVYPDKIRFNYLYDRNSSDTYLYGHRYGVGEVGEYVVIACQRFPLLGRTVQLVVNKEDAAKVGKFANCSSFVNVQGEIQLLGTFSSDLEQITSGVSIYPRIGDQIYSAPDGLLSDIPALYHGFDPAVTRVSDEGQIASLNLSQACSLKRDAAKSSDSSNAVSNKDLQETGVSPLCVYMGRLHDGGASIEIPMEDLFSRHCAILGTTGAGKSYTLAHMLEKMAKFPNSKAILIDSTGEYRKAFDYGSSDKYVLRYCVSPNSDFKNSSCEGEMYFPSSSFSESNYMALFSPSAQSQAPVLKRAIESLRLMYELERHSDEKPYSAWREELSVEDDRDLIVKVNRSMETYKKASRDSKIAAALQNPYAPFKIDRLTAQIENECVRTNAASWGKEDGNLLGYCQTLIIRIDEMLQGGRMPFTPVTGEALSFSDYGEDQGALARFMDDAAKRLMLIDISNVTAIGDVRAVLVDAIACHLMSFARTGRNIGRPLLLFLDEAHNFIGKNIGLDDGLNRLTGVEQIAREGRKFSLNLCLATQRPRDLEATILSQMGTMIVHRLVNEQDRSMVQSSNGDASSTLLRFLPDLQQGEAMIFGTGMPIPLDVEIDAPVLPPQSESARFSEYWR